MVMANKKRQTKEQREIQQKSALRRRIADIATGAAGYEFDQETEWASAEFLSRFVCALQVLFGTEKNEYLWKPHCLNYWENIDSATNALWEHGVRP
jgi:hypothetical protein